MRYFLLPLTETSLARGIGKAAARGQLIASAGRPLRGAPRGLGTGHAVPLAAIAAAANHLLSMAAGTVEQARRTLHRQVHADACCTMYPIARNCSRPWSTR
jgi:hypothetical protein